MAHTTASATPLRRLKVDLHIHTVVSPCAEVEMIPPLIIARARELGLGMIAVTDHNTIDNVGAVQRAAIGSGITVLPGMEVQTREEAHILCLFEHLTDAEAWQETVYREMPALENRADVFGPQFVVDETGEFIRENGRLLLTSTRLSAERVVDGVRALGGLTIAAHVDRPSYSLLVSLGFVPEGLRLEALEISRWTSVTAFAESHPELAHWPLLVSGDAHRLNEMLAATEINVAEASLSELVLALRGKEGRNLSVRDASLRIR